MVKREGRYFPFPDEKKDFGDVESYLRKADPHRAIRSSIPDAIQSAHTQAELAATRLKKFTFAGVAAVIAVLITMAFGTIQIAGLFNTANSQLRYSQKELQVVRCQLEDEKRNSEKIQTDINELKSRLQDLQPKSKNTRTGK